MNSNHHSGTRPDIVASKQCLAGNVGCTLAEINKKGEEGGRHGPRPFVRVGVSLILPCLTRERHLPLSGLTTSAGRERQVLNFLADQPNGGTPPSQARSNTGSAPMRHQNGLWRASQQFRVPYPHLLQRGRLHTTKGQR